MIKLRDILNELNDSGYSSWKRKNVTLRGVKKLGEHNNVYGSLGKGLYTVPLSNKSMAKQYGTVYFVVNAIPKNPKIFNTLNEWEIWFYNKLVYQYSLANGNDHPDRRDFNKNTTIEKELQKLGFDGIIIKGREMVNYKPEDVLYFENEIKLKEYYEEI